MEETYSIKKNCRVAAWQNMAAYFADRIGRRSSF